MGGVFSRVSRIQGKHQLSPLIAAMTMLTHLRLTLFATFFSKSTATVVSAGLKGRFSWAAGSTCRGAII
jgi:hypothetical protein